MIKGYQKLDTCKTPLMPLNLCHLRPTKYKVSIEGAQK